MAFDIALHFGTLMAVVVIYFTEWWKLFIGAIRDLTVKKKRRGNVLVFGSCYYTCCISWIYLR